MSYDDSDPTTTLAPSIPTSGIETTAADEEDLARRRDKNRLNARRSRERKRLVMETLQQEHWKLSQDNQRMKEENAKLKAAIAAIKRFKVAQSQHTSPTSGGAGMSPGDASAYAAAAAAAAIPRHHQQLPASMLLGNNPLTPGAQPASDAALVAAPTGHPGSSSTAGSAQQPSQSGTSDTASAAAASANNTSVPSVQDLSRAASLLQTQHAMAGTIPLTAGNLASAMSANQVPPGSAAAGASAVTTPLATLLALQALQQGGLASPSPGAVLPGLQLPGSNPAGANAVVDQLKRSNPALAAQLATLGLQNGPAATLQQQMALLAQASAATPQTTAALAPTLSAMVAASAALLGNGGQPVVQPAVDPTAMIAISSLSALLQAQYSNSLPSLLNASPELALLSQSLAQANAPGGVLPTHQSQQQQQQQQAHLLHAAQGLSAQHLLQQTMSANDSIPSRVSSDADHDDASPSRSFAADMEGGASLSG